MRAQKIVNAAFRKQGKIEGLDLNEDCSAGVTEAYKATTPYMMTDQLHLEAQIPALACMFRLQLSLITYVYPCIGVQIPTGISSMTFRPCSEYQHELDQTAANLHAESIRER